MDSFSAQLPVGLASPAKPPLPPPTATSSQRSAGTVSGGEVAQLPAGALAPAGSLKRALSSCAEAGAEDSDTSSQGYSKSQRGSVAATPARRPAAQLARSAWGPADSGDEAADSAAGSGDDGLEFLLRACEMLDPHLEVARWVLRAGVHASMDRWVAGGCCSGWAPHSCSPCVLLREMGWNKWWQKSRVAASCRQLGGMSTEPQALLSIWVATPLLWPEPPTLAGPTRRHTRAASVPNLQQYGGAPSAHGTPKITRQSRHGAASLEASPAGPARRPVSRRLLARGAQSDADWEAGSDYDTADADADYMPSGGVSRPARAAARAARATARSTAAAALAPAASEPAAPAPAPRGGRWGDQPKQMITGPCMNPGAGAVDWCIMRLWVHLSGALRCSLHCRLVALIVLFGRPHTPACAQQSTNPSRSSLPACRVRAPAGEPPVAQGPAAVSHPVQCLRHALAAQRHAQAAGAPPRPAIQEQAQALEGQGSSGGSGSAGGSGPSGGSSSCSSHPGGAAGGDGAAAPLPLAHAAQAAVNGRPAGT